MSDIKRQVWLDRHRIWLCEKCGGHSNKPIDKALKRLPGCREIRYQTPENASSRFFGTHAVCADLTPIVIVYSRFCIERFAMIPTLMAVVGVISTIWYLTNGDPDVFGFVILVPCAYIIAFFVLHLPVKQIFVDENAIPDDAFLPFSGRVF